MRIRAAGIADLDAVWEIERAVFGREAWSRDAMGEEIVGPHRHYVVLVDDDAVRGYAGLLTVGVEGDVQTIAVEPGARGSGHGRRLMDELLGEAERRGAREVFLEVRADNPVARGLYETLGFEEIGVRPRYYQPDDVDAIVMRRTRHPARSAERGTAAPADAQADPATRRSTAMGGSDDE